MRNSLLERQRDVHTESSSERGGGRSRSSGPIGGSAANGLIVTYVNGASPERPPAPAPAPTPGPAPRPRPLLPAWCGFAGGLRPRPTFCMAAARSAAAACRYAGAELRACALIASD